jgi:hypothetical protein
MSKMANKISLAKGAKWPRRGGDYTPALRRKWILVSDPVEIWVPSNSYHRDEKHNKLLNLTCCPFATSVLKLKLFTTIPVRTGCRLWAPPFAMPYKTYKHEVDR